MDHLIKDRKKLKEGFIGQQSIVLPPDVKRNVAKNPLTKLLYLTALGYYPRAGSHDRERKFGSQQYILLYCVEGSGYIELAKQRFVLAPNTYFIVPKNVPHHYAAVDTDPWSIYWVHFAGDHAPLLYDRDTEGRPIGAKAIAFDERRVELFNEIFNMLENSYQSRSMELVGAKLLQLLSSFIYDHELHPANNPTDHIQGSISFMKQNLGRNYSLGELAQQLNYSVSHYAEQFKKKTGLSPMQYFNQLKIQKSCQYLYFTDMNIKEICQMVGFGDPYYFSRTFKKLMGLSPAKYRSSHKK